MTEALQQTTQATIKDKITAKTVIQGYMNNKNLTQIAEEMGITRGGLYARLNKNEVQEIMVLEAHTLETKLHTWIQELHESPNSANKRAAMQELTKIVKHVQDKAYPSIFRTERITVNIDLTEHIRTEQIHLETISRLPPTHRQLYQTTYNQVKQEYT